MISSAEYRVPIKARHVSRLSSITRSYRQSICIDRGTILEMSVCALPALALLTSGERTLSSRWLHVSALVMFGVCVIRRQYARCAAIVIGLTPMLMLLRNDFSYSLLIVLLAAVIAYWFVLMPRNVEDLWANVQIKLMLILSTSYWLLSFWLTGNYSVNLRVLELAFSVCLIFLLANSPQHLFTALVGIGFGALGICIALMPYGDRLGMAWIDGRQLGNPISLGIPLALIIALAIADKGRWLFLDKSFAGRMLVGVTAMVLLLLTTSRGSIAVALVCVFVILCLAKQKGGTVVLLALLTLAIPFSLATPRGVYLEQWFGRTVSSTRTLTEISSGRSDQWLLFPQVFTDSPLWGSGPGLGRSQYAKYSIKDQRIEYRSGQNADWHSIYLQLGIEAGLIGWICLGIVIVPVLVGCFKHWRTSGEVVPMIGVVGFLAVAGTVPALDAVSGVFLGLGFLGTRLAKPVFNFALTERILPLTRRKAKRYLPVLSMLVAEPKAEYWSQQQWMLDLPDKWKLSWIVLREDIPIGCLVASREESAVHIHRIAPTAKDPTGLCERLLHTAVRQARAEGYDSIQLKADPANQLAMNVYVRVGFRKSSADNSVMVLEV